MASDPRLFFKLHNGFPEHPKSVGLSDKAFRHLIELWCYCSRNLTDGLVQLAQSKRILTPKTRKELIEAGFIREVENGLEMHDYLEHQESAESVENRRNTRATAGAKGGKAKAERLANASRMPQQTASKNVADKDIDKDIDTATNVAVGARKRATRLPQHFTIDQVMLEWAAAKAPAVNLEAATEKFINYWSAKAGKDATKVDWVATWRNWILRDQEFQQQQRARNDRPDHAERSRAKGVALLAKWDTQQQQEHQFEIGA